MPGFQPLSVWPDDRTGAHPPQQQHSLRQQQEDSHMLWRKGRRSDNVVDARDDSNAGSGGLRFGGGKGLSLGAIVLIVGIGLLTGQDPMQILGELSHQLSNQPLATTQQTRQAPPANDEQADFVRAILG